MKKLNLFSRSASRKSTILYFQMPTGPKRRPGFQLETGTGKPFTQPGQQANPVGSRKEMNMQDPASSVSGEPRTTTLPDSQPMSQGSKRGTKTKTKNKRKNQYRGGSYMNPFKGKRPGEEIPTPEQERIPSGIVPYRDGPPTFTTSEPIGKIGQLPNLTQESVDWNVTSNDINNIRTLFQVLVPHWFSSYPSHTNTDNSLNTNQELIFLHMFNRIREVYQQKFNLNTQFFDVFRVDKVFAYFHDVHNLHAELVCLIQRAAYYRNLDTGMENILLDTLSNVLNTTEFYDLRNRMARALRFSYLPKSVIDETYETFQTYRMGNLVTSSSTMYVTALMGSLIGALGTASNNEAYETAVTEYTDEINALIFKVTFGRSNNASGTDGIQRAWRTTDSDGVSNSHSVQIFAAGTGGITENQIPYLNSIFARVAEQTGLTLLNNVREGNSQSHVDGDFNDRFNNQLAVFGPTSVTPYMTNSSNTSPERYRSVAFASEKKPEDVLYKSVMYQAEKFTGASQLFFRTSNDYNSSRFYLKQRDRKVSLLPEQDVLFTTHNHFCVPGDNGRPFVQDNYVSKNFKTSASSAEILYMQNTDATSAAMWFLTFGDLMEKQYNHGIKILN